MKLRTHGLAVEIEITSRTFDPDTPEPYDVWLDCSARIEVPAFSGKVRWNAQPIDFRTFREELVHLNENVGKPGCATLAGLEPGIKLNLFMMKDGHMTGEYEFTDYGGFGPDAPMLTGGFELDQTFLPELIRDVDALLNTKARSGR